MLLAPVLHIEGNVGVAELVLMLVLIVIALAAFHLALRIPRLSEYQQDDEDKTNLR